MADLAVQTAHIAAHERVPEGKGKGEMKFSIVEEIKDRKKSQGHKEREYTFRY